VVLPERAVDAGELEALLGEAMAIPSPAGAEEALAEHLAQHLVERCPGATVRLERFAPGRANLVAEVGTGRGGRLLLYSHLDTSLSGDPVLDRFAAPEDPGTGLAREGDLLVGRGVAVAKGPAVAALLGFAAAAPLLRDAPGGATLLLAAGGTHRAAPASLRFAPGVPAGGAGAGVRRFLAGARPSAALVAKAGPPAVLHEEPGAAFLVVSLAGPGGLVMSRTAALAHGGVPAALGAAVAGVEAARTRFLARDLPAGSQAGRELGVGAACTGLPYKPDLFGALAELYAYAVLAPGDDAGTLAGEVEAAVREALGRARHAEVSVRVEVLEAAPSQRTDPRARIVRLARAAYEQVRKVPPRPVERWTGSTDGVVLRAAGIETARVGPTPVAHPSGVEALRLADLVDAARIYATVALAYALEPGVEAAGDA